IGPGGGRPHSTSSTRPAPRSYEHQRPTLDALRPGPERVVVTNANDLERPLYAQRDRVAGLPPEHAGLERRRIGGRPVQPLEPEGEGHPVPHPGPDGPVSIRNGLRLPGLARFEARTFPPNRPFSHISLGSTMRFPHGARGVNAPGRNRTCGTFPPDMLAGPSGPRQLCDAGNALSSVLSGVGREVGNGYGAPASRVLS